MRYNIRLGDDMAKYFLNNVINSIIFSSLPYLYTIYRAFMFPIWLW